MKIKLAGDDEREQKEQTMGKPDGKHNRAIVKVNEKKREVDPKRQKAVSDLKTGLWQFMGATSVLFRHFRVGGKNAGHFFSIAAFFFTE